MGSKTLVGYRKASAGNQLNSSVNNLKNEGSDNTVIQGSNISKLSESLLRNYRGTNNLLFGNQANGSMNQLLNEGSDNQIIQGSNIIHYSPTLVEGSEKKAAQKQKKPQEKPNDIMDEIAAAYKAQVMEALKQMQEDYISSLELDVEEISNETEDFGDYLSDVEVEETDSGVGPLDYLGKMKQGLSEMGKSLKSSFEDLNLFDKEGYTPKVTRPSLEDSLEDVAVMADNSREEGIYETASELNEEEREAYLDEVSKLDSERPSLEDSLEDNVVVNYDDGAKASNRTTHEPFTVTMKDETGWHEEEL